MEVPAAAEDARTPPPGSPGSGGAAARARWARIARDPTSALLIAQLAVAATAFVANILASRALQPDGRGQLALLLQIAYLCSLGLLLGTDRSVVAVHPAGPARGVGGVMSRLLVVPSLVGLVLATAAVLGLPLVDRADWQAGLAVAASFALVNAFVRTVRSVAIASGRYADYLRSTLAAQVLLLLGLVGLLAAGVHRPAVWVAGYVVSGALPTLWCLGRWRRLENPAGFDGRAALVRREGLAVFPAAVADTGMLRIDRLLLPALASTASLGIYASVATMTELLAWPAIAYADSRLGAWRLRHDSGHLRRGEVVGWTAAYAVGGGLLLALVLSAILVPLLGDAYAPAQSLVLPLTAAAAVYAIGQVVATLLVAVRRGRAASIAATTGFAVSLVAYLALIPSHGAAGAAYGSIVGYGAALVVAGGCLLRAPAGGGARVPEAGP